ncbi:hypothetical protein [Microvirga arabica]|nr:hypothetical protein [Microvirga arabica]MBM1172667.1 hypothetical protein [Microvirga arabica]
MAAEAAKTAEAAAKVTGMAAGSLTAGGEATPMGAEEVRVVRVAAAATGEKTVKATAIAEAEAVETATAVRPKAVGGGATETTTEPEAVRPAATAVVWAEATAAA